MKKFATSSDATSWKDVKVLLASVFCLFLAGCARHEIHFVVEKSKVSLPPLTYKALPLAVGLVLDQNFRAYTKTQSEIEMGTGFIVEATLRPGSESALAFARFTGAMFERAKTIQDFAEASKQSPEFDLIIRPRIVDADGSVSAFPTWMKLAYETDVYDSQLRLISQLNFSARGENAKIQFSRQSRYEATLGQTMRNLPAQFAMAFEDDTAIQQWLKKRGVTRAAAKLSAGSGLVVLEQADTASLANCIESKIRSAIPELKILSAQTVQDKLYPWFEPDTWLEDADAMSQLLRRPGVPEKLNEMSLRFILYVTSQTTSDSPEESGGGS